MKMEQIKSKVLNTDRRVTWLLGAASVAALGALWLWPRRTNESELQDEQNPPLLFMDIRQELNGLVEEPDLIDLELEGSIVTLRGQVFEDELEPLIAVLESMPGVSEVVNHLMTRSDGSESLYQ